MTELDPEVEHFARQLSADWAAHPPLPGLSMPEARAVAESVRARWTAGGPAMARTDEIIVNTEAGPLRLRLHRPAGLPDGPAPTLLYIHGGGFVIFSLDTHDRLMREYAAAGGFIVVGVDYPLSPEHRFPVALERLVGLIDWLSDHGAPLGIEPARLAIGGDSAGANLSLVTAIRLRDAGKGGALRGIMSNYGAFSPVVSDEAERDHGGREAMLTQADMIAYFEHYLGTGTEWHPHAIPMLLNDLAGLPPVLVIVAERDVLAEQSLAMAEKLKDAGVFVKTEIYRGATHSFLEAASISTLARSAIADGARWIANVLDCQPPSE